MEKELIIFENKTEFIPVYQNEKGDKLVSARELHEKIENHFIKKIKNLSLLTISKLTNNKINNEYELLLLDNEIYDMFDLVILDSISEQLYKLNITENCLVSNKRIPSGSDNRYGNYFEKYFINNFNEIFSPYKLKHKQHKLMDGVCIINNVEHVIEIKCNKTNTTVQVNRYKKANNINKSFTINGTGDINVNFNYMDLYRLTTCFWTEKGRQWIIQKLKECAIL